MQIDFTKLQKLFVAKIRNEENLILRGQDISFEIQPNYEFEQYSLQVKLKVFKEEFSIGYPKANTTEEQLLLDFFSRLHDYNTDDPNWHIIRLKIQELERRYNKKIQYLREIILSNFNEIKSEDIFINISDQTPIENDARGFPKFEIFVMVKGEQIATKEIEFYEYNHKLVEELENEIRKNINRSE